MKTIYGILWAIVGIAIMAGVSAMSLSPPTPYSFAKYAFVSSAAFFVALVYLWGVHSSDEKKEIRIWLGLFGIVCPIIIVPALFWYIDVRAERSLIEFAALDISDISNSDLKSRASHLIDRINEFQLESEQNIYKIIELNTHYNPQSMTKEEQTKLFQIQTNKMLSETVRQNNEWRRHYLSEVLALISITKERMPNIPEPDYRARPALDGILAGVAPASEAAKYLGSVVSKLPD